MASFAAKKLLEGEDIAIINAEKAVIIGNRDYILNRYKQRIDRADIANPRRGPHYPRTPEGIVRRTIKGMLPSKKFRGRTALRNLEIFQGVPEKYKKADDVPIDNILEKTARYTTIGEISRFLGYT